MALSETSTKFAIQWRAFVGPKFGRNTDADFWDWTLLDYGATYTPAADTTLAAGVAAPDATAALTSAAGAGTTGGGWIGPNAAGEAWEYVTWTGKSTNTLTGLTREYQNAEQTGIHTTGAVFRYWWPLTMNDGALDWSRDCDQTWSADGWRASIKGVTAPQAALRLHHLVLVQRRDAENALGDWGAWKIELVCWINGVRISDDATRSATWEVQITDLLGMAEGIRIPALRVGDLDVARYGTASGSTAIAATYKEYQSGEFVTDNPQAGADMAIDGNPLTLYATDRYVGTGLSGNANRPAGMGDKGLDQIHPAGYTGQPAGYRWFQANISTCTELPHFKASDGSYPVVKGSFSAGLLLVVENERLFAAENPSATDPAHDVQQQIVELKPSTVDSWGGGGSDAPTYWDAITAGESLQLDSQTAVTWSDLAPGETVRRIWGDDSWESGPVSSPGYYISDEEQPWIMVQLPGMGLTLGGNGMADTGGTLLFDGTTQADDILLLQGDVLGSDFLPDAGTLQVDQEQISYTAKRTDLGGVNGLTRGDNSTTAAAHEPGAAVWLIDDGAAVDCPNVTSVILERTSGKPMLSDIHLFASSGIGQPPTPPDDYWFTHWDELWSDADNAANPLTITTGLPGRYKWLLVVCSLMTTNPYRLMLNTLQVIADAATVNPDTVMATDDVYTVAAQLGKLAGIPAAAFVDGTGTPTIDDVTTQAGNFSTTLRDLMDMTGCYVASGRDSKLTITPLAAWLDPAGAARTWTRTTLSQWQPDWAGSRRVSQVVLAWMDLNGQERGEVRYPDVPGAYGEAARVNQGQPQRFASLSAAQVAAAKHYWRLQLPFAGTGQCVGAPMDAAPGLVEGVQWQIDSTMLQMDRLMFLDGVTMRYEGGGVQCVIHGVELDRRGYLYGAPS